MTVIKLTWAEVLLAANVGVLRNVQSLKLGRKRIGNDDTWDCNIEGACGEMAVAKNFGNFWSGAIGNIDADDVGTYQVKTNTSRKWDDLILRKWNKPDRIYIGVLSFLPSFTITGWIYGEEGMQEKYYRDGRPGMPAYFVPRSVLRPLDTLLVGNDALV